MLTITEYLKKEVDVDFVTTASPFIAKSIKKEFGTSIKTRSSVNMRVGSVSAMEQLADAFDGFYVKKELNRNPKRIAELKAWCERNGKTLHLLANSGCLYDCAFQTFHDNLIAHERASSSPSSPVRHPAPCHEFLENMDELDALARFLGGSFIRPEDMHVYEPLFDEVKLATRMHSRPRMVLRAYAKGHFSGNLLDLTEPSYSRLLKPCVLDARLIPEDWFEHALRCNHECDSCTVCKSAAEAALTKLDF